MIPRESIHPLVIKNRSLRSKTRDKRNPGYQVVCDNTGQLQGFVYGDNYSERSLKVKDLGLKLYGVLIHHKKH